MYINKFIFHYQGGKNRKVKSVGNLHDACIVELCVIRSHNHSQQNIILVTVICF